MPGSRKGHNVKVALARRVRYEQPLPYSAGNAQRQLGGGDGLAVERPYEEARRVPKRAESKDCENMKNEPNFGGACSTAGSGA